MTTILLPVQTLPVFEPLAEIKPAERNFIKFKQNGLTMFVILTGGQPDQLTREDDSVGELVVNRAPPTRHNIQAFETLLSDRLIKRGDEAKKINVTLEVLPDGVNWDSYYTIWDEDTLQSQFAGLVKESQKLAFKLKHLYIGDKKYLGEPRLHVYETSKEKEVDIYKVEEELDTVKVDGQFLDYKKRVFKQVKVEELDEKEKTFVRSVKLGGVLEARMFEAPPDYLEKPREAYVNKIIEIEKRPKPVNERDNLAGGANHINKVFSNCFSKVQQRSNPKKGGNSESLFTNALGAQIISNKKASNGTNAASSETPVQTWQAVVRLLSLFQRTGQSDQRKTLAISCIARVVTSLSTYENNATIKTAFTQKGNLIKGRIEGEPNSAQHGLELLEFVKHFGAWAIKHGTASTDQIVPTPGSLSMFGAWDDKEPEALPLAVKMARFQNLSLEALTEIPTTLFSWKPDKAEAFVRALTTFNLYDASPETIQYCLTDKFAERPRQYPFAPSGALGIIPNGTKSPLVIDSELLSNNIWIGRALVQKARVQEPVEQQPIVAFINPRGLNGDYIDTVRFLDEKKGEVISYEETVQNIMEDKPNDFTKSVRSIWYDVSTGEPIPNGGPTKITNYLGIGPFAELDYTVTNLDQSKKVEIFMQFLTSGLAHSNKVMKRTSKAATYTRDEFLVLPEMDWPLLQKRKQKVQVPRPGSGISALKRKRDEKEPERSKDDRRSLPVRVQTNFETPMSVQTGPILEGGSTEAETVDEEEMPDENSVKTS